MPICKFAWFYISTYRQFRSCCARENHIHVLKKYFEIVLIIQYVSPFYHGVARYRSLTLHRPKCWNLSLTRVTFPYEIKHSRAIKTEVTVEWTYLQKEVGGGGEERGNLKSGNTRRFFFGYGYFVSIFFKICCKIF